MLTTFLLLCIIAIGSLNRATYHFIPLVKQVNVNELFFDLSNRVQCQRYTDKFGFPTLKTVDNFVIPPYESMNTVRGSANDCDRLAFQFNTIREKQDLDPTNITLELYYHNASRNGPNDHPFFSRTFARPGNGGTWDTRLNIPVTSTLTLVRGDLGDDGVTVFDMSDQTFLPVSTTLWAGMYVTMPLHLLPSLQQANRFYWVTLNNKTGSTPLVDTLFGLPNHNYKVRNEADKNGRKSNMTDWTDATVYQPIMGIHTTTFNMAWALSIYCNVPWSPLATNAPVSHAPSAEPTETESPTGEPTTVITELPTGEPTLEETFTENTTAAPTSAPWVNVTEWVERVSERTIAEKMIFVVTFVLLSLVTIILICVIVRVKRHRKGKLNEEGNKARISDYVIEMEEKGKSTFNNGEPFLINGDSEDYDDFTLIQQQQQPVKNNNPLITDAISYMQISLSTEEDDHKNTKKNSNFDPDGNKKSVSTVADWFNSKTSDKVKHI